MLSHFSVVRLCDPVDCSLLGSSVHGILQARILEWVAMPSSRGTSNLGVESASLMSPVLGHGFITTRCHLGSYCLTVIKLKIHKDQTITK